MANDSDEEKELEPSERRKQEFRDQGKIPRSREVLGAAGLGVGFLVLISCAGRMGEDLQGLTASIYATIPENHLDAEGALTFGGMILDRLARVLAIPLGALWITALGVGLLQGQGVIPDPPLKIEFNKLNPWTGIQQTLLSKTPLVELAKGLMKIGLVGWVVWLGVRDEIGMLPDLVEEDPAQVLTVMAEFAWIVTLRALPIAGVIAALDYAYQWHQLHEQMKMSKQEMKDEHKRSEGDPHVKSARRAKQRELARRAGAIKAVAQADVIITNPTHYAIALRYRPGETHAPIVIARGVDHLALKMQAEARKHDIPRIENRPLARALYAQCKEGQMIPEDLYQAVADVLAIVYRRRQARGAPIHRQ